MSAIAMNSQHTTSSPSSATEKTGLKLVTPLPANAMSSTSPFPINQGLQKPICVFCGSSPGTLPLYTSSAQAVGAALAKEKIPLVYGGGRRGIMGVVSLSALQAGGYVHGVLPRALITRASERTNTPTAGSEGTSSSGTPPSEAGKNVSQPISGGIIRSSEGIGKDLLEDDIEGRLTMQVTHSMHERKLKMAQLSTGGFVVLPGGYGTYEEMMEMITWNQLGIHRVPVLILNIANFYTPLRGLLENAVNAGFIAPQNLSLCQIVDLPGGSAANLDESRAEEWGTATIEALKAWSFDSKVGYALNWNDLPGSGHANGQAEEKDPAFSLFTTMRFTTYCKFPRTVDKIQISLVDKHIARLRTAHAHFSEQDSSKWGKWPGDEAVWLAIRKRLENVENGDWRVRALIHPDPRHQVEVQAIPAPAGILPFRLLPESRRAAKRRPMILDPKNYEPDVESSEAKDKRLYKMTDRHLYDAAGHRGSLLYPAIDHPEVLLHTRTHLLESVTSNIAIQIPRVGNESESDWITPKLDVERRPFLDGVMRQFLLEEGVIKECEVTVDDWKQAKAAGWRVIGFNGLRGVWEGEPM